VHHSLTRACVLGIFLVACSSDTSTGDDASTDATIADAPKETATSDAAKEASNDAALDAPEDATSDAQQDAPLDAPDDALDAADDAPQDAAMDAADSGAIDAGSFDAGKKSCIGVFCIIGDTCCNNTNSADYGTCQPTSCKTCCK
jgi:hypothetical protein